MSPFHIADLLEGLLSKLWGQIFFNRHTKGESFGGCEEAEPVAKFGSGCL